MPFLYRKTRIAGRLLGVALLVATSLAAWADGGPEVSQSQRVYQQDRERCLSGQSNQSQETCLREAGAARQQNMAAQSPASAAQLDANAAQRCETFTGDEYQSCLARMQGQGSVQGSVEAGGVLRELTEPVK
jgi:uncharacterized protein HemX